MSTLPNNWPFSYLQYLVGDEGRKLWFYSENWSPGGRKPCSFVHSINVYSAPPVGTGNTACNKTDVVSALMEYGL